VRLLPLEVLADPESCRLTSAQLARLGDACLEAARRLYRQSQVGEDDLGGLCGDAYRLRVSGLADTCDRLATRCARLADGLADYARGIEDVRRLLRAARSEAAPSLTTCDRAIWSPSRPPDPDDLALTRQWAAWHAAVQAWRAARALEVLTERRWLHLLRPDPAAGDPDPGGSGDVLPPVHDYDDLGPPPVTYDDGGQVVPGVPHGQPHGQPHAVPVPEPHAAPVDPPVVLPVSWALGYGLGSGLGPALEGGGGDVIGPGDRDLYLPPADNGDGDDGPVGAAR
jgi:hypothetical protein